jgi:hypothetical protein
MNFCGSLKAIKQGNQVCCYIDGISLAVPILEDWVAGRTLEKGTLTYGYMLY